jgi:hypothetical protein
MANIKPFQNKEDGGVLPITVPDNQAWYSREYNSTLITQVRVLGQSSGIAIDPNVNVEHKSIDPLLLAKAVSNYSHAGNFYIDSGTANDYILTPANSFDVLDQNNTLHSASKPNMQSTSSILNGMIVRWRPLFANTGASTITIRCNVLTYNVGTQLQEVSLATYTYPLKLEDGITTLTSNKVKNTKDNQARFDSVNNCFVLISSGGGVSTSYSGAVVNGVTESTITLTNADTNLETITEIKNDFEITITPNATTSKFAVVTLANSNLTNTKIFTKDKTTGVYSQVGQNGEFQANISFNVTYITDEPSVNSGNPFLLAGDLSGLGLIIKIDAYQSYTATTSGSTITLTNPFGINATSYINTMAGYFIADANNTGDWNALFFGLPSKQIVNATTGLALTGGEIIAGKMYCVRYNATTDKLLLSNQEFILPATQTSPGIASLATNAEALGGIVNNKIITPESFHATATSIRLQTANISNQATLDITNINIANYNNFFIDIDGLVPVSNGVNLNLLVSTDNGASFITTATYDYGISGRSSGGGNLTNDAIAATSISIGYTTAGNLWGNTSVTAGSNGNLQIFCGQLASATNLKLFTLTGSYCTNTANRIAPINGTAMNRTLLPINALRFSFSAGNILSGSFTLYGLK